MNNNKDNTSQPSTDLDRASDIARDRLGQFEVGNNANPTGKGGFGDRPQDINAGGWKKADTARFKLEQMMQMNEGELKQIVDDPYRPMFEQKLATSIINGQWTVIKEMMQEVYGRKTDIDMNVKTDDSVAIIKGFVIPTAPADFLGDDGVQREQ